jgi:predicted dehydrogenase
VMHLLGHPRALAVSALTAAPFARREPYREWGVEVEDFGAAWVRLETGAVFVFKISWAMHAESLGASLLLGSEAGLRLEAGGGLGDAGVARMELFRDLDGQPVRTELPVRAARESRAFLRKMEDFVRAVQTGGPAPIPGRQVLRSMAIIDAIYRSAAAGREVEVPAV